MTERTTVRLPEGLLREAKRKAARESRTLTSLIEEGLRLIVSATPKSPPKKRVLPRISNATGGLLPGIDLSDSAALQESDDIAYAEQLRRRDDPA